MNIVFDLDGTLIDSFKRHFTVLLDALDQQQLLYNSWLTEKDFMEFKRSGASTSEYLSFFSPLTKTEVENVIAYWKTHIEDINNLIQDFLFYDSKKCLDDLKRNDIYFLSSRSKPNNLIQEIEWLGIAKYPKDIQIVSPPNATYKKAAVLSSFDNRNTIYIGDTEMDYQSARDSKIPFIALNRGFRSREFWDKINICSYDDLLSVMNLIYDFGGK